MCPHKKMAIVKVAADTQHFSDMSDPASDQGGASQRLDKQQQQMKRRLGEGPVLVPYRNKAIALFMSDQTVGDLLIFVMYVKEYGPECPDEYAR